MTGQAFAVGSDTESSSRTDKTKTDSYKTQVDDASFCRVCLFLDLMLENCPLVQNAADIQGRRNQNLCAYCQARLWARGTSSGPLWLSPATKIFESESGREKKRRKHMETIT